MVNNLKVEKEKEADFALVIPDSDSSRVTEECVICTASATLKVMFYGLTLGRKRLS